MALMSHHDVSLLCTTIVFVVSGNICRVFVSA